MSWNEVRQVSSKLTDSLIIYADKLVLQPCLLRDYLTIAAIFAPGRFKLENYETTARDTQPAHDFFNPGFPSDSKGIRVAIG